MARPKRSSEKPLVLSDSFPGADSWGLMAPIGGSWRQSDDWSCLSCNCKHQLVVWRGGEIVFQECFKCWDSGVIQLVLFL